MPRNYRAEKLSCGSRFCPATLRMLWPIKAIRICDIAPIFDVGLAEVIRRAEEIGIDDQRPRRRTTRISAVRLRAIWMDPSTSLQQKAERANMLPRTLQKLAKAALFPPLKTGRQPTVFPDDFDEMWLAGVATSDIARLCNACGSTVTAEVRKRKLRRRAAGDKAKTTLAEFRLARSMAASARVTQLAFEITGRETKRHFQYLKELAA